MNYGSEELLSKRDNKKTATEERKMWRDVVANILKGHNT